VALSRDGDIQLAPAHAQGELSREGQSLREWGRRNASFLLRLYAFGLGIDADRRDDLVALADALLTAFADKRDDDWLSDMIVERSRGMAEVRLIIHAINHHLKNRYQASYRQRAIITTRIRYRCADKYRSRRKGEVTESS